jgi:hypothetical protein
VEAGLFDQCTVLHEYLEAKTTTHEFVDLDHANCMGTDSSTWDMSFDGHAGNVTLTKAGVAVTSIKTPLKVTHEQNCAATPPTLSLQMDTVVLGSLSANSLTLASGSWLIDLGESFGAAHGLMWAYHPDVMATWQGTNMASLGNSCQENQNGISAAGCTFAYCQSQCASDPKCNGVALRKDLSECWFKSGAGIATKNNAAYAFIWNNRAPMPFVGVYQGTTSSGNPPASLLSSGSPRICWNDPCSFSY